MPKNAIVKYLILAQKCMLFLSILFLPILAMSKRFTFAGLGPKASFYPLTIFIILFFIWKITTGNFRNVLKSKFIVYIFIYFIWKVITTIYGVIIYPYSNLVDYTVPQGYRKLFVFFHGHLDEVSDDVIQLTYLTLRSLKVDAMDIIFGILIAFLVYQLFYNDYQKGFLFVRRSFIALGICLIIYAIPEFIIFDFHLKFGYDILSVTNSFIYDIKTYLNWYPPLIWDNAQIRSYCVEPSILGALGVTIIPFIWSYFSQKSLLKYYILGVLFAILLYASKSRTANSASIFEIVASCYYFFMRGLKKYIFISVTVFALGFGLNILLGNLPEAMRGDFDVYEVIYNKNGYNKKESVSSYIDDNIKTIVSTNARSNGSRRTNILGHLKVAEDYPIMGVGNTFKDFYILDRLSEADLKDVEIRSISRKVSKGDIFNNGYGNVNHFAYLLASEGIVGFILFSLPIIYIATKILKLRLYKNFKILTYIVILAGNLLCMMVGLAYISYYIILGLTILEISHCEERKNE